MSWSDAVAQPRRRLLRGAAAGLLGSALAGGLAACGFELRRTPRMAFSSIALKGFSARSALAVELRRQLATQVLLRDDPARAEVVLLALNDRRDRGVVASTTAAEVREIQLRLVFDFRAETPGGRELIAPVELLLTRDFSYRESAALAKEQEEADLFREMQADIVGQVLRRLAAITL